MSQEMLQTICGTWQSKYFITNYCMAFFKMEPGAKEVLAIMLGVLFCP